MAVLKQLFIIAERKRAEKICAEIKKLGAHYENVVLAQGTARSDLLQVLGLDSAEKTLITASVFPKDVSGIMLALQRDFKFGSGGGVAFTVPIEAVSGPAGAFILAGGEL
ncbi:MAG: hypothetical protein J6Z34_04985 [Clostridia bacterium]|nr:hypothetical protein [Clostridia bacterium]